MDRAHSQPLAGFGAIKNLKQFFKREKKKGRTDRKAEAEYKAPFQRKVMHENKKLQPKSYRDQKKIEQGRTKASWEYWRLTKSCSIRAVEGGVRRRRYKPFGVSNMHKLSKQGVPDRFIMATSGNKFF